MLVNNLELKKAHPLLSQIPMSIWGGDFKEQFNDDGLRIAGKNFEEVKRTDFPTHATPLQVFVLLLISYPKAPRESIFWFAKKELSLHDLSIFWLCASLGRKDVIEFFEIIKTPDELTSMVAEHRYKAARNACEEGHLDILKWLTQFNPNQWIEIIRHHQSVHLRLASQNGHLPILKWVAEIIPPEYINSMVRADVYDMFCMAAKHGHLNILQWLAKIAPQYLEDMITKRNQKACEYALENGHLDVVKWLIQHPVCLAAIESRCEDSEYNILSHREVVYPFIEEVISSLRQEYERLLKSQPQAVLRVTDPERCQLLFYMLRNLIRRNDRALDKDIGLLLNIPELRAIAHGVEKVKPRLRIKARGVYVEEDTPNELLQLAKKTHNDAVCRMLLTIPAVSELEKLQNFKRKRKQENVYENLAASPLVSVTKYAGLYSNTANSAALDPEEYKESEIRPPYS